MSLILVVQDTKLYFFENAENILLIWLALKLEKYLDLLL